MTLPDGYGCRKECYLGRYGTKESKREYEKVIAEWLANGRRLSVKTDATGKNEWTVNELVAHFWDHIQQHTEKTSNPRVK